MPADRRLSAEALGQGRAESGSRFLHAIGAAEPSGSAYENYHNTTPGAPQFLQRLRSRYPQEDTNGNYGFQSSDVVEYLSRRRSRLLHRPIPSGTVIAMNLPAD